MKTSVTKIMMSFALMGCLIIGASDASAQGRSRSQGGSSSSRSQSAAVSRSSSSTAPTVSRSSSSPSRSSSATPQVGRSSSSSSRSSSATPQVGRSSSSSSRSGHSATTRGSGNSGNSGSSVTRHSDSQPQMGNHGTTPRVDRSTQSGSSTQRGDRDRKGRNPGGNDNHGNKGKGGRDNNGGIDNGRHGNGGNGGNRPDGNRPPSNRPSDKGGHGGNHGGNHGYNPNHRFDYSSHHYRDQFSWNHSHHNWSRPLPPPARAYRPAPLIWRRPVIPAGWHPYAGAPIIDRVLGLMFGTLYEVSLDQLYYDGYYIDGYADNIIYLRDVSMLNLYWPDVMLSYEYGKLANAQFVYHSGYYDRSRFDRVYNSLCRIYGSPVYQDGMTISWYGGNNTGWVTLTMTDSYGDYYTTMSIGY